MTGKAAAATASAYLLVLPSLQSAPPRAAATTHERVVEYTPAPWAPDVWPSRPPEDCPFNRSVDIQGLAFTHRWAAYTDADTWYPSWALDGNMYSGWTDGEIGEESVHSSGRARARTGNAKIVGDDPLNLQIVSLGSSPASAEPYGGRYPSANLVHDGIWYYGTYVIDFDPQAPEYSWAVLGPVPGFRISRDYGKTWIDSPLSPVNPLFPESGKNGQKVKMGTPHFVDFGKNMEHSPDGKAYLVGHGASQPDAKPRKANLSWIAGDEIYLARVSPSPDTINRLAAYEFFAGHDPAGQPVWSRDFAQIKPLVAWNNRMGGVTITYNAPLRKYLMCITDGWPGVEDMNTYVLESAAITGPWKLVSFMRGFGRQGYFSNFPSKFISADGRTAWLCYSANFHKSYFANRARAAPLGSRYAMTLQEVRLLDAKAAREFAGHAGQTDPLKRDVNLALGARITVSSVNRQSRPFSELPAYYGEGAVDGVVDRQASGGRHEWISNGERAAAMVRLDWDAEQRVDRVWLFDRPDAKASHITSGMLVFSDGSTIRVGELPAGAAAAKEISFAPKSVRWLAFLIESVSESTRDVGLAEIAVLKAGSRVP